MQTKKVVVISLGGSVIIPNEINFKFLDEFKKVLRKEYDRFKFIIVTGGGIVARKYIDALKFEHRKEKTLALIGIRATRMNAMFLMQFFGEDANASLPKDMKSVEASLHKNHLVICGALRFEDHSTSDSTAAKLASHLKVPFINMTNVKGLYTSDPRTNKSARLIERQTWAEFEKKAKKIDYHPGQHFVLDQKASTLIKKNKTKTYIIGPDLKNFQDILNDRPFIGTIIEG